jgi:hypothetical protein
MKQEMCVLPVQCKRCGAVFDLWYDLQESKRTDMSELLSKTRVEKSLKESLCWQCRQVVFRKLEDDNVSDEEDFDELLLEID